MFAGAGRCCRRCRPWHRAHRERVEQPEAAPPPPVTTVAPHPLDRADGAELVAGILRRAEADAAVGGLAEQFDAPSTAAYRHSPRAEAPSSRMSCASRYAASCAPS